MRHRLRQPVCKSLCNDIVQMQQCMAEPGDVQTAPDAHMHRHLKQHLRVRRWALAIGFLFSSLTFLLPQDWHSSKLIACGRSFALTLFQAES